MPSLDNMSDKLLLVAVHLLVFAVILYMISITRTAELLGVIGFIVGVAGFFFKYQEMKTK